MNAETIAKALGGRKAGGGWMARCPAHDDREPSLSIRDADDGKVLVRCHAGCDQDAGHRRSAVARSVDGERSAPVHPPRASRRCREPAGSRRRQAQRSRTRHLAVRDAGRADRWSRPISPRAACISRHRRRSASMPG